MLRILVVAAEEFELKGILRHCREVRRERRSAAFASTGELNGNRLLLVANGPGPHLARKAAAAAEGEPVDAVMSTGLCGALDPSLQRYEVFVADRVNKFPAARPVADRAFQLGALLSEERFIGSAAEKRELARSGERAVEMEAEVVAQFAAARGVPFYCVRVVSDTALEDSVIDFNLMRDAEGRFSRPRLVLEAVKRPATAAPELIGWFRRSRTASSILGDFIANCRF